MTTPSLHDGRARRPGRVRDGDPYGEPVAHVAGRDVTDPGGGAGQRLPVAVPLVAARRRGRAPPARGDDEAVAVASYARDAGGLHLREGREFAGLGG
ncbi:hypothetical protein G5V59_09530 [Nocardioides sp. W3-2-3]|uniref:hypothetical protein n=1 Tax=Nocardioides convexus TaxID=2712224 RepID=UPI002418AA62|nr:hypothetical protein [Nocardioides convexus]NHA00266.1 hypothetical protein [Nocardioides convexus]